MNKNLEELKQISEDEKDFKSLRLQYFVIYYLIPVLEDFGKQIETLSKKVKKLEQKEVIK